jgi:hypothetical protein
MAIDPRISLGVQPIQIDNPLAQYGQVQNILAAQQQRQTAGLQNQLTGVQLSQAQLTLKQAQEAQDAIGKIMGAVQEHGGPADPMEAAMQMLRHPNPTVQATGGHLLDANQKLMAYQQQVAFLKDQTPNALTVQPEAVPAPQFQEAPAFGVQGRAAPAEPSAAISTTPQNKLVSASAAPVNAMTAPQEMTAQTLKSQINSGDIKYGAAPGWLKQRELLVDEYKQLIKPEFEFREVPNADGTISYQAINKRTGVAQPVKTAANSEMSGVNIPAQRLAFDKEVEKYKRDNPGKTIHTIVNDDGTTSLLAVDNKTGVAEKVTLGGVEIKGVDTASQRLKWEKEHPTQEIKEVSNADGSTKLVAVDKQAGTAKPVTIGGEPLVGAKYVPPTEMAKLISERDQLPAGSPERKAYDAKINQAAEQNRISQAHLNIATKRLNEELAMGNVKPETIEMFANMVLQGQQLPPLGMGKKSADVKAQIYNRAQEISSGKGVTPADTATNIVQGKQDVAGQTNTIKDFSSGISARKVTANNTALNHLATLDKLADDLTNSDTRIVNAAANIFAKATGSAAPSNFDAAKQLVAGEVMKAVTANGGGVTERQEAERNITSAGSPQQLRGVIKTYKELLGGQLSSLQVQYETGSGRKDFDKKLTPAAREILNKSNPTAPATTKSGATVSNW